MHNVMRCVSPSCILYRSGGLRSRHTLRISTPSTARDDSEGSDTSWQRAIIDILSELVVMNRRMDGLDRRLGQRMDGLDRRMDGLDRRMDGLDRRMEGMGQRMEGMDRRVSSITERLIRGAQHLVGPVELQDLADVAALLAGARFQDGVSRRPSQRRTANDLEHQLAKMLSQVTSTRTAARLG
jgi:hypothetical protein